MNQIHFFALNEDLLPVFQTVEQDSVLKYIWMGQAPTPDFEIYAHGAEIPNLGIARTDSVSGCQSYLITKCDVLIKARPIDVGGAERYAMDQLINPDTIVFTPGGLWGEDVVLNGRVGTVSDSAIAQELMKRFNSAFGKRFRKIKAFSVGPKAFALLNAGNRLTASAQSPREFDLTVT